MSIPKTIFQTYKTSNLPLITRWHVACMKRNNPAYKYEFYDDARIDAFIKEEYGDEIFALYKRINIGAAKADFFRYAILYKKGGVYLDIDSLMKKKLDDYISPNDSAIISLEGGQTCYVQWALIYEAGHPFLKYTLDEILENIRQNKFPHDVHQMTGPTAYTIAVNKCINSNNDVNFRQLGVDYDGLFKFSFRMSKFFMYGFSRKNHWKKEILTKTVLKDC